MPIYEYRCPDCCRDFDKTVSMSEATASQTCPECGSAARRVLDAGVNFALKGDQWPGKALRVKGQMASKNRKLDAKQREHRAPIAKLVPNVNGERVDSWSEAKKLAHDKGKDTASYDRLTR